MKTVAGLFGSSWGLRSIKEGPTGAGADAAARAVGKGPTPRRGPRFIGLAALSAGREPSLHLLFPGIWKLNISPGFKNFIAFVPIDDGRMLYYLRSYLPARWGLLGWLFHRITRWSNRLVLGQDRRIVVTQTPACSLDARDDHLVGSDRAIIEYRRWLARASA